MIFGEIMRYFRKFQDIFVQNNLVPTGPHGLNPNMTGITTSCMTLRTIYNLPQN